MVFQLKQQSRNPGGTNQQTYLQSIRANSVYSTVRKTHELLVVLATIGTALLLIIMLAEASATAVPVAVSMAVGIFIERAMFVAVLDAADVLIDMSRRMRDNGPGRAETPKAGTE